mmetsp:Transcript_62904/g.116946  ORF Transcript_62904/g.116946 Transcript_62904/m.116946 type:complete len:238 (+) Transcript_62904:160-873(+)
MWRVSTHGRVWNTRGQISYGSKSCGGGLKVVIQSQNYLVHRLVAFAHLRLPPTPLHDRVLHCDGDRASNHVSNLKYATQAECGVAAAQARRARGCLNSQKVVLSRAAGEGVEDGSASVNRKGFAKHHGQLHGTGAQLSRHLHPGCTESLWLPCSRDKRHYASCASTRTLQLHTSIAKLLLGCQSYRRQQAEQLSRELGVCNPCTECRTCCPNPSPETLLAAYACTGTAAVQQGVDTL